MKFKSIILSLVGAALLSLSPGIGQAQTTKEAKPKQEATPSHVVLHSMRARRLHAKRGKGTAMTKGVKQKANAATAKNGKQKGTVGKKMVRKAPSKTTKGKVGSSKLMPRTKHVPKKHQTPKKSSRKS